ncbi:hypothetical protein QBC41DRAFT_924 [Cercophora samala]|uniref:Uncharacterized protein n=1 Tax=Cercophora samala TaxID=330535 RepID=A0AA39ZNI5_9PEZI|nr:hypothetical protein QBC41DRAFT_924 [Cercophora samala]
MGRFGSVAFAFFLPGFIQFCIKLPYVLHAMAGRGIVFGFFKKFCLIVVYGIVFLSLLLCYAMLCRLPGCQNEMCNAMQCLMLRQYYPHAHCLSPLMIQ